MISCIIIDDQQEAIDIIRDHVSNKPELSLVKTFLNPLEALRFLEVTAIDVVFADVQMPHLNGLDLIESLREKKGNAIPKFIFTTGHNQFALPGFEQGVTDYLLKPIGFKRFNTAVDRLLANLSKPTPPTTSDPDFFFAEANGKKVKINFKDIAYIESAGNYITLAGPKLKLLIYKSMNGMQEILPSETFLRVHKSYIVSVNFIEAMRGNELILNIEGKPQELPIGATFKEALLTKLRI